MILRDQCEPFWRHITLEATERSVEAEVADNVHHFATTIVHDGEAVTKVDGKAIRVPWVTCPGAIAQLSELVGTPVRHDSRAQIDQTQQCTHMLDLARLAIAHVRRGGRLRYDCRVSYDAGQDAAVARLMRNGELFVEWLVKDGKVVSPGPFFGHDTRGRSQWSAAVQADRDLREAGLIIRRAVFIYRSRSYSAPRLKASDTQGMSGVCYSFQPERASIAFRPQGFVDLP